MTLFPSDKARAPAPTLDVAKAWLRETLQHTRQLYAATFSHDGSHVFAGAQDGTLLRWPLAADPLPAEKPPAGAKKPPATTPIEFKEHTAWISCLLVSGDGTRLFSSDLHGRLIAWDTPSDASKKPTVTWKVSDAHPSRPGQPGWIRALAVTGDHQTVCTAGTDGIIRLWSAQTGKPQGTLEGHQGDIFSLAMHPDGKTLISGDIFGVVHQWDLSSKTSKRTFDAKALHTRKDNFLADVGGVRSLAFNREGTLLACGGMTDAKSNSFCPGHPGVLLFDFASGKQSKILRLKKGKPDDGPIKGLVFLEHGILVGQGERLHANCSLEFWDVDSGTVLHTIDTPSGYDLDVHPDGRTICTPIYALNGRSGNGRHATPEEYQPHFGHVRVYRLTEKPAANKT